MMKSSVAFLLKRFRMIGREAAGAAPLPFWRFIGNRRSGCLYFV